MIKGLLSIIFTIIGFIYYSLFKKTPSFFFQSYVRSYCFTNGLISEILSKIIIFKNKKKINNNFSSTYKKNEDLLEIKNLLKKKGYYVFEEKLEKNIVSKIHEFTLQNDCFFYDNKGNKKSAKYNNEIKKNSSKFYYNQSQIFNIPEINNIIFDPFIIDICENYFDAPAYLSNIDMWWSPVKKKLKIENEIANRSAQYFHFDLDRIKWLKLFIYLTDTKLESGPHEYVEGTHGFSNKDKNLLNSGYQRIEEDLIYKKYNEKRIKKILGERGTMFIGDTSAFHRGALPKKEDRLLLVIEYSNSLFGGEYSKIETNKNINFKTNLMLKDKLEIK